MIHLHRIPLYKQDVNQRRYRTETMMNLHQLTSNKRNRSQNLRLAKIEDSRKNQKRKKLLVLFREIHHRLIKMVLPSVDPVISMKRIRRMFHFIPSLLLIFIITISGYFSSQINKLESDLQRLNQVLERQRASEIQLRAQLSELKTVRKDLDDLRAENSALQTK